MIRLLPILLIFLFSSFSGWTQKKEKPKPVGIELSGDRMIFDQARNDAQRVLGNVKVKHENTVMYCDSAWYYSKKNLLRAFGHIHVKQGDTLNLYGDSLLYDGNTRIGKLRGKIRMIEQDLNLETDSLDFNVKEGNVWYTGGAKIRSQKNKNELTSKRGEYRSSIKELFFKDSVVLTHPEYQMFCDTLRYRTATETAVFEGPTLIRTKEGIIYCEKGWYDTRKEKSLFSGNTYIKSKEHLIKGDTIIYNRLSQTGFAHGHFEMTDTVNEAIVSGRYGEFDETKGKLLVTKDALLTRYFDKDSLYLHADTLKADKDEKTGKQIMRAFHGVKFYKSDIQGKCDSLAFDERDSSMRMYYKPVLWNEENQLSAELIELKTKNQHLDSVILYDNCFIISAADTVGFNQIKGRKIAGKFNDDQIRSVKITGNGQTVYYAGEKGKPLIGMNKAECSDIVIYLNGKKISGIVFITQPDAVFYPMNKINPKDKILKDFKWIPQLRPMSKADVLK